MAVSCSLNAAPTAPAHGGTVTCTYTVTGNDPIDPSSATITGRVVVGGVAHDVSTTVTLPGTPAAAVSYVVPVSSDPALIFAATADPAVFTAPVP